MPHASRRAGTAPRQAEAHDGVCSRHLSSVPRTSPHPPSYPTSPLQNVPAEKLFTRERAIQQVGVVSGGG